MILADTSLVLPALVSWHERHVDAVRALEETEALAAHVSLETFATLTRLPAPFGVDARVAAQALMDSYGDAIVHPDPELVATLPRRLAAGRISGGATYDAVVAVTAETHRALLRTADRRAERTYRLLGIDYEVIA